jgi:hypothetical protein
MIFINICSVIMSGKNASFRDCANERVSEIKLTKLVKVEIVLIYLFCGLHAPINYYYHYYIPTHTIDTFNLNLFMLLRTKTY